MMDVEPHFFNRYRNTRNGVEFDGVRQRIGTPKPKFLGVVKMLYRVNVKPKRKLEFKLHAREFYDRKRFRTPRDIEIYLMDCLMANGFDLSKTYYTYEDTLQTTRTFVQYL